MGKVFQRHHKLTAQEQRQIVREAVPGRIREIRECLRSVPARKITDRSCSSFESDWQFSRHRTVWGFDLRSHKYRDHRSKQSWESRLQTGGTFVNTASLSPEHRLILEAGIDCTNKEFVHLTYYSDPSNQDAGGGPANNYGQVLDGKIRKFAELVIELFEAEY